jgi:hypothetical protein
MASLLSILSTITDVSNPDKVVAQINPPLWIKAKNISVKDYKTILNQEVCVYTDQGHFMVAQHKWGFGRGGGDEYVVMLTDKWIELGQPKYEP